MNTYIEILSLVLMTFLTIGVVAMVSAFVCVVYKFIKQELED